MAVPKSIKDPSPGVFLAACIIYSVAIVVYHQIRKGSDDYQNHVLIFGLIATIVVGCALGNSMQTLILSYLTWAAILSLTCSARVHDFIRWIRTRQATCDWGEREEGPLDSRDLLEKLPRRHKDDGSSSERWSVE